MAKIQSSLENHIGTIVLDHAEHRNALKSLDLNYLKY